MVRCDGTMVPCSGDRPRPSDIRTFVLDHRTSAPSPPRTAHQRSESEPRPQVYGNAGGMYCSV